jgi:hypothetical protein
MKVGLPPLVMPSLEGTERPRHFGWSILLWLAVELLSGCLFPSLSRANFPESRQEAGVAFLRPVDRIVLPERVYLKGEAVVACFFFSSISQRGGGPL